MLQPRPCFLRAPGVGLALVDLETEIVHGGYPISGGADAVLATAIAVAKCRTGIVPSVPTWESRLAEELLVDWRELGGPSAHPAPADRTATPFDTSAFEITRIGDPHSSSALTSAQWAIIQESLIGQGLVLERRSNQSSLLGASAFCEVLEIRDGDKVLAEGKGLTYDEALRGVLGEAVERLTAQRPESGRLILATARELAAQGLTIPNFVTESRDLFSPDLPLEWVTARTFSGRGGALPAELTYFPFQPSTAVKAFSAQHTAGLAAGASGAAASAAALREAVETDAYWLSMRCMRICSRFEALTEIGVPDIRHLVRSLADLGIHTHAGLINFDWPLPIVHVVLESTGDGLPALSHGLALGEDQFSALRRALVEAVQVFTGLEKVARLYWPEISVGLSRESIPALAWSDPSYASRIVEMFEDAPPLDPSAASAHLSNVRELVSWITQQGMTAWCAPLGRHYGLQVVRAYIEGGVSPFSERGSPSLRMRETLKRFGLRHPYLDPVFT